ncbi:MAG: Csp1 family four helix bundle copper storage protein [Magnetococcales bacterium]|nr:Csp1 family four helix bundle copper storage protein [Magnetococcales bacterium]
MSTPMQPPVNRRQLLTAGATAALVATIAGDLFAAEDHSGHAKHGDQHRSVVAAARECETEAINCLSHCLMQFQAGDTSLAACATRVVELIPLSHALAQLASMNSPLLAKLAAVCVEACKTCETECRKHAEKHAACKACADACAACIKACQPLV